MRKFVLALTLLFALFTPIAPAIAQIADGPRDFGFAFAVDYSKWSFRSNGDVAAGAVVITVKETEGSAVTPDGRSFRPLSITAPLLIDGGSAAAETATPSAISCAAGALTCSFSITLGSAHSGNFTIQSGTFGLAEAKNAILARTTGGTVVVANGFGGTTSTITSGWNGSALVNILDVRTGVFQFYTSSGSTYSASQSPLNSGTTPNADVTTAVGAPFVYTGAASTATNYGITTIANAASANGAKIAGMKTRTTNADGNANTIIVTGDDLLQIDAFGADGVDFINTAGILFDSTGTIGATRVPSVIKFFTGTDAAPTVKTLALTLGADQSATLVGQFNAPTVNNTAGALALKTTTSGNITLTPAAAATAAVTMGAARFEMAAGAAIASGGGGCVSGDCTLGGDGNVFLISGTTTVDGFATAGWQPGSIVWIQTSGSVTFNSAGTVAGGYAAMALTGNLSMTANDTVGLLYDGTSWVEIALIQR